MNTVSVFLPVRKGSQRIADKNTKPFSVHRGGLFELKLHQLLSCPLISEVVVSTNCDKVMEIFDNFLSTVYISSPRSRPNYKCLQRPEELCGDDLKHSDLIDYAARVTQGDHIMLTHCTSPLVDHVQYGSVICEYFKGLQWGYDSILSARKFFNFVFDHNGKMINNSTDQKWPRTQDLDPLFEVNSAVFLAPRSVYNKYHDRVGIKPLFYPMNAIQSIDVDWPEDFLIAEAVYNKMNTLYAESGS